MSYRKKYYQALLVVDQRFYGEYRNSGIDDKKARKTNSLKRRFSGRRLQRCNPSVTWMARVAPIDSPSSDPILDFRKYVFPTKAAIFAADVISRLMFISVAPLWFDDPSIDTKK